VGTTQPKNANPAIHYAAHSFDEQKTQESEIYVCCRWIAADYGRFPDGLHHLTRLLIFFRFFQIIRPQSKKQQQIWQILVMNKSGCQLQCEEISSRALS
jgi:hypothetical protein